MTPKPMHTLLGLLVLFVPFSLSFANPAYDSTQDYMDEIGKVNHYNTYSNSELIRWKVSESTYIGQTLVNGNKGLGLEMGDGRYVYSLNNQMLSFSIRF